MLKRKFTKVLSVFLCMCMMISVVPFASATDSSSSPESETPVGNVINDVSVSGTNSFGEMLSEAYYDDYSQEEINGYDVYSVDFVGNVATVEFDTLQSATLVLGLYNEDDQSRMITSESVQVSKGETSTEITFDSEKMPEYFIIKAYLVDSKTFRPLNKEYTSPMYTYDMQYLKQLSTTDFPEEQVLNLDDDTENNFAVYNSSVKVISETEEVNVLKSADDANGTYVFENIGDSIFSLQAGDVFSYAYGDDGLIIAKVSEITIDGTTATIISTDVEMEDVFDYTKIYAVPDASQATIGSEELPEGVVYNGLVSNQAKTTSKGVVASGVSGSVSTPSCSLSFGLNDYELNDYFKVNANVNLGITPQVEFNLTPENQYFELKFDYSVGINASVSADRGLETPTNPTNSGETATTASSPTSSGETATTASSPTNSTESTTAPATSTSVVASSSAAPMSMIASGSTSSVTTVEARGNLLPRIIDFFSVTFTPVAGVTISLTPGLAFSANAEISFSGELSGTVGISISNGNVDNITTTPKVTTELKVEGSIFVGVVLRPEVSVLGPLAHAELDGVIGAELTASMNLLSFDTSEALCIEDSIHECDGCIAGEITAQMSLSYSADILNLDFLSLSGDLLSVEFKITDFYYSITHNEVGFGECPYQSYRITANVVDIDNSPIKSAHVNVVKSDDGEVVKIGTDNDYGITDDEGKISFYLLPGEYNFIALDAENKYSEVSEKVTVEDEAKSVYIELVKYDEITNTENRQQQLSFARNHSACITENGDLYMWGNNSHGHLGIGKTSTYNSIPIKTMSNVKDVSLGVNHSACVTEDGELYTWGYNGYYQLGDGTTTTRLNPVNILSNVRAVSLGNFGGAAVTKNNNLFTWGKNYSGLLGDGTLEDRSIPKKILSDVKMVCMGNGHGAAIKENGDLYLWGNNGTGSIGTGNQKIKQYLSPEFIMGNVKYVSLGDSHSACITENGDLYMWGYNNCGQLGNGTKENVHSPEFLMSNVKQVSLGYMHSGAITEDGELYMWGYNHFGQLGDGSNENKLVPTKITTIPDKVKEIELGENYTGVLTESGEIYTWGCNSCGCLGDGTIADKNTPTKITLPTETSKVSSNSSSRLSSTPNKKTVVTSGAGASSSNSFDDLQPNEIYNFYAMKSRNVAKPLSSENLLYITQGISDENGVLNIECTMTEDYENAVCFVVPMKQIDLSNATVTMDNLVYNGKEQFIHPTVTLDGVTLTEGKDYELCNYYYAQNVGEYKVIIRGIGSYNGAIEFKYYVNNKANNKLGDVNFDEKISIIDAVLVLRYILNPETLSDEAQVVADMNQDGNISVVDAIMIQRVLLN